MKVLDVYSKKDLDKLTIKGKSVNSIMEDFWLNFPLYYRRNYDKNLESLELLRVDEHYEDAVGEYSDIHNLIIFRKYSAIIHELMHMASRDAETQSAAFIKNKYELLFESSLIEGCTEFLASFALKDKPTDYFFETFCASMLSNIDGFFEPYFVPNYDKFIGLFPNKKDILSLMYSLNFYADNFSLIFDTRGKERDYLVKRLRHSVTDVIDSLIDIQLSFNYDMKKNQAYSEEFLGLINGKDLSEYLSEVRKDYFTYAEGQIKRRILRR